MSSAFTVRTLAILAIAATSACQPAAAPSPAGTPDNANSPTSSQTHDVATQATLQRYLDQEGKDIEACFTEMPALETDAAGAEFRKPDGTAAAPVGHIVMAIDASGSMAARVGGESKMTAAKRAASDFLSSLPAGVSVGLLAFGHRGSNRPADKAASCAAVEPVYAVGVFERQRIAAALGAFDARGWTPLAAAIEASGRMLPSAPSGAPQAVYVVSDGEDTCGGDPVAAARALHGEGTRAIVNVIGFDLGPDDRAQLAAVARAGGGSFTEIAEDSMASFSDELRRKNRNFIQRMQADNANTSRQMRNDNRVFTAGLKLKNCVFTRSLQESNGLTAWAREQALPQDETETVQAALQARHATQATRAEAIVSNAVGAKDTANARIQSAQEAINQEAEGVQ